MKVALVTPRLPPQTDGVGDYAVQLASALAGKDVCVELVTSATQTGELPADPLIQVLPMVKSWGWVGVARLAKALSRSQADAVNLQFAPHLYSRYGMSFPVSALPLLIRRKTRKPVLTTCHELLGHRAQWVKGRLLQVLYYVQGWLLFLGSSRVVVPTRWQEEKLKRAYPKFAEKVYRIPVGSSVPVSRRSMGSAPAQDPNRPKPKEVTLAVFGTGPWWRHRMAMEILRELLSRVFPSRLLMMGDVEGAYPAYYQSLRLLESQWKLTERILWTGRLSEEEISRHLQTVDVFLALLKGGVTARNTALIAALAHGLPIVATQGPDAEDWLVESGAFYLIPPDGVADATEAVIRLIGETALRQRLRQKALELHREHFSWEKIGNRYLELLNPLVSQAGPSTTEDSFDPVWQRCWSEWLKKPHFEEDIAQHRQERGALYRLLQEGLVESGTEVPKVIEVGCGTAIDACILAEDSHTRVFAADRSLKALQVARQISAAFRRFPTFLATDAARLSFPDETFDLVFSQGLLEHFVDPLPYLKEQVRVLKRSGTLVLDVPQKYAGLGTYCLRKRLKIWQGKWPWGWETQFSYFQLKRLGRAAGLVPVAVAGYGFDGMFNLLANPHVMIDKLPFLRSLWPAQWFKRFYLRFLRQGNERLWNGLCQRFGHWFLISIVVRFKKA